jgi:hypothetical protein
MKLLYTFGLITFLASLCRPISAYDFTKDGLYYTITSSKDLTVEVSCKFTRSADNNYISGDVSIPSSVTYLGKTYSVTSIGHSAFSNCSLSNIEIPSSVDKIEYLAFENCILLSHVTLPNKPLDIDESSFSGCTRLQYNEYGNALYLGSDDNSFVVLIKAKSYQIETCNTNTQCLTIANDAFMDCTKLKDITLSNNIINIGNSVFAGCLSLDNLSIPNSVTRIGSSAFRNCSSLTNISIGNNVIEIGREAFYNCTLLQFTEYMNALYLGNNDNPYIVLYKAINTNIENCTINNNCHCILDYAFRDCTKLKGVFSIPNGVRFIGEYALLNCNKLTSLNIPNGITSLNTRVFSGCRGLVGTFIIPDNVIDINDGAFEYCSNINRIIIGNGVKSIGSRSFYDCYGLNTIIVGNSLKSIANDAFSPVPKRVYNLSSLALKEGDLNSNYSYNYKVYIFNNCQMNGEFIEQIVNEERFVCDYIGDEINLTLPNATGVSEDAFYNCPNMISVVIPESMSKIGNNAFSECTKLSKVTIENSNAELSVGYKSNASNAAYFYGLFVDSPIKELYIGRDLIYSTHGYHSSYPGNGAPFERNSKLKYITTAGGITSIDDYCFNGCNNIQSLTIGSGITEISASSFSGNPIKTFWLTNTPPTNYKKAQGYVNYAANDNLSELNNVEVYSNLSSMFEVDGIRYVLVNPAQRTCDALDVFSVHSDSILSIDAQVTYRNINLSVKQIGQYIAYNRKDIKELNIDEGIVAIKSKAFSDCSSLQNVQLGNDITTLGDSAFAGAITLQTVDLGETLTTIGNAAFEGCQVLQNLAIPNAVTSIGAYAFSRCSSINSILLPQSVNTISDNAFKGCTSLFNVVVENRTSALSVGSNGKSALFADCPLDSVYIGGKISYNVSPDAGYSPFYRNTTLRTVVIADNETEIHDNEFYGCTNLKNVTIGDGVKKIGDYAFSGCSKLKSFIFGASMESIGKEAFSDCTVLTSLYSEATTPPTCGNQALEDINKWECTLYVPIDNIAQYQEAEQWRDFFFIEANPLVEPQEPSPYTIADGSALTNTQDETFRYLNYSRTFANTNWQALYVPFAIPVDSLTEHGLQVAELNDTHQWDLDGDGAADSTRMEFFTLTTGSTEPNYPYLIKANETMELTLNLEDVEVKATEEKSYECSSLKQRFTFVGTYTGVSGADMYSNNYYGMAGGGLKRVADATVPLKPQRWYMKIENKNGSPVSYYAPSIRFSIDGFEDESETTGIASMISGNREEGEDIFSLDGIRQTTGSLKPGLYVHQGKKLVIR